ncbi:MAG TPA: SurA N-terminal domain-containing protein, partial [Verrucomicrobiae bacterium]|nr:SurA N-terminal domain-containing protein [Verrucomicrobiae bacterium]
MFRFFRKHQWLLIVILGITVISFVLWMPNVAQNGGGAGGSDYGTIYGQKITPSMYNEADHDIRLLYLFRYGQWPERIPNLSKSDLQSQIFGRILMMMKAKQLGVYVSADDVAAAADQMLRSPELSQQLGFKGRNIPFNDFLAGILQPEGLGADDFQHFVRDDLKIHQLVGTLGLAGALITPQEAEQLYRRTHQPISAEAVFFSYSNYLSGVAVSPAAIGEFYTNHLAEYRLPDRVQISYVAFEITNYMAAAEKQIGITNLNYEVDNLYRQNGMSAVPGAKTPEEAKAAIREMVLKREAANEATTKAKEFATTLFAMDPPKPQNLAVLAKTNGLTVKTTAPFNSQYGPDEFLAPAALTRA